MYACNVYYENGNYWQRVDHQKATFDIYTKSRSIQFDSYSEPNIARTKYHFPEYCHYN